MGKSKISDIGAIVINFLRPDATIKCLKSLQKECPDLSIYVGDQDDDNRVLLSFCQENNINYIKLSFDCGIGVGRNTLIEYAKKDNCQYIMWGDNDFIYDKKLRLDNALKILDNDSSVGIVGGTVINHGNIQHYERLIYYNKDYQTACFIPLEYTYPEVYYTEGVDYYYCDMTFNFCVARVGIFDEEVCWDSEIKVKHEHSFFFLKFLEYNKLRVAYCPSMMVNHEHGGSAEYNQFRYRVSDGVIYARKLGLKTGFAVNEVSWDHTLQKQIDFKKVAKESPTFQSALKHSKLKEEKQEKENIIVLPEESPKSFLLFQTIQDIILKLQEQDIPFVLLNKTCLEIVNNHKLPSNQKELYLGYKTLKNIKNYLLENGFTEKNEKQLIYNELTVYLESYLGNSKKSSLDNLQVDIPIPVIAYLKSKFGVNWRVLHG